MYVYLHDNTHCISGCGVCHFVGFKDCIISLTALKGLGTITISLPKLMFAQRIRWLPTEHVYTIFGKRQNPLAKCMDNRADEKQKKRSGFTGQTEKDCNSRETEGAIARTSESTQRSDAKSK